jgi:hypothetical protein
MRGRLGGIGHLRTVAFAVVVKGFAAFVRAGFNKRFTHHFLRGFIWTHTVLVAGVSLVIAWALYVAMRASPSTVLVTLAGHAVWTFGIGVARGHLWLTWPLALVGLALISFWLTMIPKPPLLTGTIVCTYCDRWIIVGVFARPTIFIATRIVCAFVDVDAAILLAWTVLVPLVTVARIITARSLLAGTMLLPTAQFLIVTHQLWTGAILIAMPASFALAPVLAYRNSGVIVRVETCSAMLSAWFGETFVDVFVALLAFPSLWALASEVVGQICAMRFVLTHWWPIFIFAVIDVCLAEVATPALVALAPRGGWRAEGAIIGFRVNKLEALAVLLAATIVALAALQRRVAIKVTTGLKLFGGLDPRVGFALVRAHVPRDTWVGSSWLIPIAALNTAHCSVRHQAAIGSLAGCDCDCPRAVCETMDWLRLRYYDFGHFTCWRFLLGNLGRDRRTGELDAAAVQRSNPVAAVVCERKLNRALAVLKDRRLQGHFDQFGQIGRF